ncbi:MAG: glycosyltransferase family 2 protein [Candidatus Krumholzibacteriota bacterium]|nr:glycosyltransferase family 2 protein [Candidatus Krumholzibacteriota bacterium]
METAAIRLFFGIIVLIAYSYAGYPLVLFALGLLRARKRESAEVDLPSIALVISAFNEERIIREKIENSLKLDYPRDRLRIVVASDGSDDATNEIVRGFEKANVVLKAFPRREGKSATLNRAVLGLEEEILVFSDANAFYREDALLKLVRSFADEETGCVVGKLVYMDNNSYVGKGESIYWRYESLLNRLESRLDSVLVATGTIFAIRRELFRPVLRDVANDFQIPADVASQGYGVVYEDDAVALEHATFFCREEFGRKRRIIVRGLTGFHNLRHNFGGSFRVFQFVSRKLLRWWVGPMLPVLYLSNLALVGRPFFAAVFALHNLFYATAIVGSILRRGRVKSRILLVPFYFVMVNAAGLAAIATYLSGGRLASWEKAETTRAVAEQEAPAPRLTVIEGKKPAYADESTGVENLERIT